MITWTPHPLLPVPTDEEMSVMTADELSALYAAREEAISNSIHDKYHYGHIFPHWKRVMEELGTHNEALISGGNRCLGAEQEIYDPVANVSRKVSEINGPFHVYAWDGNKRVIAQAEQPFEKASAALYRVRLSNGDSLVCSGAHLLLTPIGWRQLIDLRFMDVLVGVGEKPVTIERIQYLRHDAVWDFTVPEYHNYVAAGVVSHNSSKTTIGAYMVVKAAIENPYSDIFCFAQTAEVSIRQQQSAVWDWLPPEYRNRQASDGAYISYKRKTGFSDNSFILPNGSRVTFKTYSQYANNPTILEGAELGSHTPQWINIGVWLDEFLGGPEMVDTLRFRLATRNAKMILTFTPIFGMTDLVKQYVDGAKVIESRSAELLEGETIPTILECKKINGTVHYFWSEDNPWGGYERIRETLTGKPKNEILVRAYGVATKSHASRFPKFNKAINVIPADRIPKENVTRYMVLDPAGSKNWAFCWIAVDETNTMYVYREWPDINVGPWADWKGGKWMLSEGARGLGYGIRDYVDLMLDMERGEEIFERLIDPRMGAAKYQVADGSSSIIEDLLEQGMHFIPAPGLEVEDGLQALISKMSYDTTKPIDGVNRPHFYVSDECENMIMALSEYTGLGGREEAWKDFVDLVRYAAVANIEYIDERKLVTTRQSKGGY